MAWRVEEFKKRFAIQGRNEWDEFEKEEKEDPQKKLDEFI